MYALTIHVVFHLQAFRVYPVYFLHKKYLFSEIHTFLGACQHKYIH